MERNNDRWDRISDLVGDALAVSPETRDSWLREATAEEPGLYEQVREILAMENTEATGFAFALQEEAGSIEFEESVQAGDRIGPYRIVRQIGRGGMGIVYEALRCDEEFSHSVAIKLIARGAESPQLIRRFRAERKLLAGLNHSNIARIFDGGSTADGRPYFVMELVAGRPLLDYCREENLSIHDRLLLFVKICAAVQHAHERMIVHRDIKPGNILVTADGVPKLLDFGIAKVIDAADETATGAQMMTPDYASPEQVRGDEVTAAMDVYALGAVLYELLTWKKAHRFKDRSVFEITRTICEVDPIRPSMAVPKLRGQLAGDLDNIVLMAMRKEAARRYPSVRQFAEDIERSLTDRPVTARADTIGYRTEKFVRRNWWQIVAVSVVILSLTAGLGFSLAQQRRATRRFNQVRQLANRFLFDFNDAIASTPGTVKAREMVVSTALEYLNSLAADAGRDPGLQWELAVAYRKVAEAQGSTSTPSLGRVGDAAVSYDKALDLARPLLKRKLLDDRQRETLVNMVVDAEIAHFTLSDHATAVALGREAVELSAGLPDPVQRKALNQLSTALGRAGDLPGSLAARERTLPMMREAAKRQPTFQNELALANTLSNLGYFKSRLTKFEDARKDETEALELQRKLHWPNESDRRRRMSTTFYYLALIEGAGDRPSPGNWRAAVKLFDEDLAQLQELIDADPHDRSSRMDAGNAQIEAAYALLEIAPEEAARRAEAGGKLVDAGYAEASEVKAQALYVGAEAYRRLGQFHVAEAKLEEATRILKRLGGSSEADLNAAWARLEASLGKADAAAGYFDKSIAVYEEVLAKTPTPANAWALAQVLESAAAAVPASTESRRQRILAVWSDQNRRYPGEAYIEKQVSEAQTRLSSR
jgi:serine/threonine protein kinase